MVAENSGGKERPDGLTPRAFASLSHCSARDALIGAKIGRPASALHRIVGTLLRGFHEGQFTKQPQPRALQKARSPCDYM